MSLKKKRKPKKESKTGYLCGVDFRWDLCDDNAYPVELYGSIKAIKHNKECIKECGIVKVTVTLEEWVENGKIS